MTSTLLGLDSLLALSESVSRSTIEGDRDNFGFGTVVPKDCGLGDGRIGRPFPPLDKLCL